MQAFSVKSIDQMYSQAVKEEPRRSRTELPKFENEKETWWDMAKRFVTSSASNAKKTAAGAVGGTPSFAYSWLGKDYKGFVESSASNIFGQLDIWGKEFNKALFGGISSLPASSGKSNTGPQMLDAMLASQAARSGAGAGFRL